MEDRFFYLNTRIEQLRQVDGAQSSCKWWPRNPYDQGHPKRPPSLHRHRRIAEAAAHGFRTLAGGTERPSPKYTEILLLPD